MIIGKALLKNREREECDDENEDEKTDNDQEVLDFDDDYYNDDIDGDDENQGGLKRWQTKGMRDYHH